MKRCCLLQYVPLTWVCLSKRYGTYLTTLCPFKRVKTSFNLCHTKQFLYKTNSFIKAWSISYQIWDEVRPWEWGSTETFSTPPVSCFLRSPVVVPYHSGSDWVVHVICSSTCKWGSRSYDWQKRELFSYATKLQTMTNLTNHNSDKSF